MSRLSFAESLLYFTILFLLCIIFAMNLDNRIDFITVIVFLI